MRTLWIAAFSLHATLLVAGEAQEAAKGFQFRDVNEKSLGLWDGDKPVLVYNHGMMSKEGVAARYDRACYVHPLYGLDGEVLTEDFPKDHYHHRGIFWAWPGIRVGGKEVQSWIPAGIYSKLERWVRKEATENSAVLEAENGWYVGDRKVVKEDLRITAHKAEAISRAIDFELTWTATDQPVTLEGAAGKSYGGFTLRFGQSKAEPNANKRKDTAIITSLGPSKGKDLADTRLEWADITGEVEGAPGRSGVAIFTAKDHPDFPPTWLTRHYGCLCVGWPGVKAKDLEPGKAVRCRYRVWVHRGEADLAALQKAYDEFAKGAER